MDDKRVAERDARAAAGALLTVLGALLAMGGALMLVGVVHLSALWTACMGRCGPSPAADGLLERVVGAMGFVAGFLAMVGGMAAGSPRGAQGTKSYSRRDAR